MSDIAIVPFFPGRRPADEGAHPGLGSSERVAVMLPDQSDPAYVLYTHAGPGEVRATLEFTGPHGTRAPVAVPGWSERVIEPRRFALDAHGEPVLEAAAAGGRLVLEVQPERDLESTTWDPFGFEHLFSQQVRICLNDAETELFVCDLRRCGSLYARLLERLLPLDVQRQKGREVAQHPWFPVLLIGSDKAALYTRALVQDIAGDGRHLADPGWLMRVGLYLEFLTVMGIIEAIKDEAGDLLSPEERHAFEFSPDFAPIREHIDPDAWRTVWRQRGIRRISIWNLLAKKAATLGFLHVHHDDLKHAIELAGPNLDTSQETWQRVFRDAERAVLRNIPAAFPELDTLAPPARDFVLWHRKGRLELGRSSVPVFGDQDGLFASACNQYRASMNEVAVWAKERALMDHTGGECVPRQVSLLEAHMHQPARVRLLQQRDGYGPALDVGASLPETYTRPAAELAALIAEADLFAPLDSDQRALLARTSRPLTLGATERLMIQGTPSTRSLFLVAEGNLEVLLRSDSGEDVVVDTMGKGAVIGEMSLLTGAPHNATVRAVDHAVVYEIGESQHEPLLPALANTLGAVMTERLQRR